MNQHKNNNIDPADLKKEIAYLKRELKRKERLLQAKDSELQSYLYTVSHELKTPIISMRGYALLLEDFHNLDLTDDIKNYLERIIKNIDQMENLIDDLLEFARINVKLEECESVDVREVIDEAISELNYMSQDKNVEIKIGDNFPVALACNKNLLIRVFTNLISNAIKYSKKNNKVKIEIGYQGDEIFHKFYVKDNGIGIPANKSHLLFKLFSRLNSDNKIKGSGLGLAITKRIIDGHGGEIWAESAKGKGSTFYFTLPRK